MIGYTGIYTKHSPLSVLFSLSLSSKFYCLILHSPLSLSFLSSLLIDTCWVTTVKLVKLKGEKFFKASALMLGAGNSCCELVAVIIECPITCEGVNTRKLERDLRVCLYFMYVTTHH